MRRIDVTRYYCDLCNKGFDTEEECKKHERMHYTNWGEDDNEKIAEELRHLSNDAYNYRINGEVLGYFVSDFSALMDEAAKRLGEENK